MKSLDEIQRDNAAPIVLGADVEPKPKRRKGTSPTARTLAELRKRGWTAQVVERPWNKHSKKTQDLFGVIDVLAIVSAQPTLGGGFLGIQATTGAHHADRRAKILAEPRAKEWIDAGGRLELWTWSMTGRAGTRKRWTLRVETYEQMLESARTA